MHTICIKSQIIDIHELSYTLQQLIAILTEAWYKEYKINTSSLDITMLKINNGS